MLGCLVIGHYATVCLSSEVLDPGCRPLAEPTDKRSRRLSIPSSWPHGLPVWGLHTLLVHQPVPEVPSTIIGIALSDFLVIVSVVGYSVSGYRHRDRGAA